MNYIAYHDSYSNHYFKVCVEIYHKLRKIISSLFYYSYYTMRNALYNILLIILKVVYCRRI
jgi:hypothetical protein